MVALSRDLTVWLKGGGERGRIGKANSGRLLLHPASDFQMHLLVLLCFFISFLASKFLQPDFQTGVLTEQRSMEQGASGNM